jgi:hypothetical protein
VFHECAQQRRNQLERVHRVVEAAVLVDRCSARHRSLNEREERKIQEMNEQDRELLSNCVSAFLEFRCAGNLSIIITIDADPVNATR